MSENTGSSAGAGHHAQERNSGSHRGVGVVVAALGVVYGDIGTSPLYAFRECFQGHHGVEVSQSNILGLLSLVFWSLFSVVTIKYLVLILRADNRGEGGILAISTLVREAMASDHFARPILAVLGIFGAALLYADAAITPAISVLSAVEGLEKAAPVLAQFVLPISAVLLVFLFSLQWRGTAGVGALFGPVMVLWFSTLGVLGALQIAGNPVVFAALNPRYAVDFFVHNGFQAFYTLGSVFLVVTGAEALYADMGHFGPRPIRIGWGVLVFPALLLNYMGQGAFLLAHPDRVSALFFELAPGALTVPMIVLATVATIIASQAMISGAFSISRQAVQLGLSPRLRVVQTSSQSFGQVYLPLVNWGLLAACLVLLFSFKTSSALASAYGIAISATMLLTSIFFYFYAQYRWGWNAWLAGGLVVVFLVPDFAFFGANLLKLGTGGWVPLLGAVVLSVFSTTWAGGREALKKRLAAQSLPIEHFLDEIAHGHPTRVPGIAVFLTGNPGSVPVTLLHNYKHNKVIHSCVLLLTVRTEAVPHVPLEERIESRSLGEGFHAVTMRYGFSQSPNVPEALRQLEIEGFELDPMKTTYFLGRETLVVSDKPLKGFPRWRKHVFRALSRNSHDATRFFGIPPNRVIELGVQIEF